MVIIWIAAFSISYVGLAEVAFENGMKYPWAWIHPFLLDAFMCITSLDVIRREMNHEPTYTAWILVVAVTATSTIFNITLADPTPMSYAVHALAPIVCFLSFEVVASIIRSDIIRSDIRHKYISKESDEHQIPNETETKNDLIPQIKNMKIESEHPVEETTPYDLFQETEKEKTTNDDLEELKSTDPENNKPQFKIVKKNVKTGSTRNKIQKYLEANPDASYAEIARKFKIAQPTARKHYLKLAELGLAKQRNQN
jgi:DNA-binding transcriptional ArsR family regulator